MTASLCLLASGCAGPGGHVTADGTAGPQYVDLPPAVATTVISAVLRGALRAEPVALAAGAPATQHSDGSFLVDGSVTIRDLNRRFEWQLPDQDVATLAGLVINEAKLIPEVGQIFVRQGFRFEIVRRQRNQITSIRITPPKPDPAESAVG